MAALGRAYAWHRAKPGLTLFGAYVGHLLVTNRQLIFLSSGNNGILTALFFGFFGFFDGPRLDIVSGTTRIHDLGLAALANEGSFALPLTHITGSRIGKRLDFSNYLAIEAVHAPGAARSWSFMDRYGLRRNDLVAVQHALERERALIFERR